MSGQNEQILNMFGRPKSWREEMSDTKQQVIANLARGIPPAQIARFLGITESYVSQLKDDPEVKELVRQEAAKTSEEIEQFDSSLDEAEEVALRNISGKLPLANMQQSLQAFKVLNAARRRKDSRIMNQGQIDAPLVQIFLPAAAPEIQFLTNQQMQIVEVEGRTMTAVEPSKLRELAQKKLGRDVVPPEGDAQKAARAAETLLQLRSPKQLSKPKRIEELDITDIA